jgi:hypothetical protein
VRATRTGKLLMTLAAFVLGGQVTAQSTQHELRVMTPDFIGLRIVGSGAPGLRGVTFDYGTAAEAYLAATRGSGDLPPTRVNRFERIDVQVTRQGRWSLHVIATPFAYSGPGEPAGLALSDVRVERGATSGLSQNAIPVGGGGNSGYATSWALSTTAQRIGWRTGGTGGWRSLGFSGWDYTLRVHGDEAPGTYLTTVTYFLTFP